MRRDVVICSCANAPWRFSGMASSPALLANELYRRHPGLAGAAIHPDSRWISTGSVDEWRKVITLCRGSETPHYHRVERVFDPVARRRPGGARQSSKNSRWMPEKPAQRLGESHYASLYNGMGKFIPLHASARTRLGLSPCGSAPIPRRVADQAGGEQRCRPIASRLTEFLALGPVSRILFYALRRFGRHFSRVRLATDLSATARLRGRGGMRHTRDYRAGHPVTYFALHRKGFFLPPSSLLTRWAITPPFTLIFWNLDLRSGFKGRYSSVSLGARLTWA